MPARGSSVESQDTFTVDETHDHIMSEVRRLDAECAGLCLKTPTIPGAPVPVRKLRIH